VEAAAGVYGEMICTALYINASPSCCHHDQVCCKAMDENKTRLSKAMCTCRKKCKLLLRVVLGKIE